MGAFILNMFCDWYANGVAGAAVFSRVNIVLAQLLLDD